MARTGWGSRLTLAACASAVFAAGGIGAQQAPPAAGGPRQAGGAGRGGGSGFALFTAADADKDGSVTRPELKAAFETWFGKWSRGTGALTPAQLANGLNSVLPSPPGSGGGGVQEQAAKPEDLAAMLAAIPDKAPAVPARPRKVLVLGRAQGFVHSSIPLAAKTVEALGNKTKAWSTTITFDAADITAENLRQYDALVLASTTGMFLDDPGDPTATAARRRALLDFVRGGKGLVGIHAASDGYHGDPANPGEDSFARPGRTLAAQIVAADPNGDRKLTRDELNAVADSWFDKMDTARTGRLAQADFAARFAAAAPAPPAGGRGASGPPVDLPLWPEFNRMIGGYFKWHWNNPQLIHVKIDDPKSPLTAMFNGQGFEIRDETYTFVQDSWSRQNVRVLTSIDYSKMSAEDKAKEPAATARTDRDYGLSWIRREGQGRVFYEAHGHDEKNYAFRPLLEHLLAGIQYAVGDLKADDRPSAGGSS
jgi:type 1 glutamine amidotransferase